MLKCKAKEFKIPPKKQKKVAPTIVVPSHPRALTKVKVNTWWNPSGDPWKKVNRLTARVIASLRHRLSKASTKRGVAQEWRRPRKASPSKGTARLKHCQAQTSQGGFGPRQFRTVARRRERWFQDHKF